ncbi:MAG: hypothetical protein OHK0024_34200 [Thalassobaculales bacterium]
MPVPLELFLPVSSAISSLIVAVTFFVLWRRQAEPHLLSLGLSFTAIATVLLLLGIDRGLLPIPGRPSIGAGLFVTAAVLLLGGCLSLTGRPLPWPWLAAGGGAVFLGLMVGEHGFGSPPSNYTPPLAGLVYAAITVLFASRRAILGNTVLAGLFALRTVLNLGWLISPPEYRVLYYTADQALILAIGLALIVIDLIRTREQLETDSLRLRHHANVQEALNAQLRTEREAANKASQAKSEFLANMSHELRTPLNAVIGFSDVIAGVRLGPDVRRYAEYGSHINTAGRHLLAIINEMLEMSRIEAGRIELDMQPLSLEAVVAGVVSMTSHQAAPRGISVRVSIDPQAGTVVADEQYLRQCLINLLSNALKFSHPGGEVRLTAVAEGEDLHIAVSDDGLGIAAEDLPNIFEPFSIGGSAATRSRGGIGLGLSITRRLVERHGGSITIASTPGRGTVVTITLPRHRPADGGGAIRQAAGQEATPAS